MTDHFCGAVLPPSVMVLFLLNFSPRKSAQIAPKRISQKQRKTNFMTKNWINFRFLHICPVEKCEISPNLAKIHISPHLLCGKTEIPLHVEKFHVLKSEISPHGRFLLHLHVGDRGDKYEVCSTDFLLTFSDSLLTLY